MLSSNRSTFCGQRSQLCRLVSLDQKGQSRISKGIRLAGPERGISPKCASNDKDSVYCTRHRIWKENKIGTIKMKRFLPTASTEFHPGRGVFSRPERFNVIAKSLVKKKQKSIENFLKLALWKSLLDISELWSSLIPKARPQSIA